MKKGIVIILIVAILAISVVGFTGCSNDEQQNFPNRFVIIERQKTGSYDYIEMYDKNTKVMYVFYSNYYGGSLIMLVNADGTPMLYEGE